MKALRRLIVAVFALSLPLATLAQEAAKPAEPPKPVITPYGFVLLNAFWDGGTFLNKDYPGQAGVVKNYGTATAPSQGFENQGGAFLMSARQSRVGFKLAMNDDNWTGAALTGVIEFDFKGGHFATTSAGWNAGIMRLRLASATATWKTGYGSWAVLAGQDYGLVNPLFATSVAWVADPIFWQAGNYWRRSPQIRATYSGQMGAVGVTVQAAMLSPADGEATGVDYGAGNRSRTPDLEARLALKGKFAEGVDAQLGVGYHTNKRRYDAANPALNTNTTTDVTATLIGIDLDANLTQYLGIRGEWFDGEGVDDTYNGIRSNAVRNAGTASAPDWQAVKSSGYWAQAVVKPSAKLWLTVGMGSTKLSDFGALLATTSTTAFSRQKNEQLEGGLILNAGKYWKVGLEYCQTTTTFNDVAETEKTASQIALSSMLSF